MAWLVTGGAGYIGCHVVRVLNSAGTRVVVLDDLSTGKPDRLPAGVGLEVGSILDQVVLDRVFSAQRFDGVVHLAALKRVDESVAEPRRYFHENVEGLRILLDRCDDAGVRSFLFSSSGAVYGQSDSDAVDEDAPCRPVNPYGQSKLTGEWLVHAVGTATGMRTMALRYFNVAGAAEPHLDAQVTSRHSWPGSAGPERFSGGPRSTPSPTCCRRHGARRTRRNPVRRIVVCLRH